MDPHGLLVVGQGHDLHRPDLDDAGVVDEHVDPAEVAEGVVDQHLNLGGVGDVVHANLVAAGDCIGPRSDCGDVGDPAGDLIGLGEGHGIENERYLFAAGRDAAARLPGALQTSGADRDP